MCRSLRLLPLLAAALLTACAGTTALRDEAAVIRSSTDDLSRWFVLEARFSVTSGEERHAGRLFWRHAADGDLMRLMSPLGTVVAEIDLTPGLARLRTADRQIVEAADATSLIRRVIGIALPIDRLADWVRARPAEFSTVERDAAGRPRLIREEAWRISYEYGESGDGASERLPVRLVAAQEGGPELRLRIENWELP